jgi:hypothetical protein
MIEAEELEDRQVDYWLALADTALDQSWNSPGEREKTA